VISRYDWSFSAIVRSVSKGFSRNEQERYSKGGRHGTNRFGIFGHQRHVSPIGFTIMIAVVIVILAYKLWK